MLSLRSSLRAAFVSLLAFGSNGAQAYRWFNWQFDMTCEATGFYTPMNESELVEFVKFHHPRKTMLKPVGNGHGFGNLTTCISQGETDRESYILSLTNLNNLEVHNDNTVTFGGGWDLVDLIPELHKRGLQCQNLGSEMVQNFIGAATTGTHGTGKQHVNIGDTIVGLRVLDAHGNIHEFTKDNEAELEAYRIAIGSLGIITEVTIQAEPVKYLKRTTKVLKSPSDITELYNTIQGYADKYEQVNIFGPNLDWDYTKKTLVPKTDVTLMYFEDTNFTAVQNCSTNYCSNDCGICHRDYSCYDFANAAIATPPQGICYRGFMGQFEHFFPIENLADVGRDYFNYAISQSERMIPYKTHDSISEGNSGFETHDVTVETRLVKGDSNLISPVNTDNLPANFSGNFATLEYTWFPQYNNYTEQYFAQELLYEFTPQFGEKYNVRPHWNKMLSFNSTYARSIYPRLDKWLEIQEKMDPDCQFMNRLVANTLGIERCQAQLGLDN